MRMPATIGGLLPLAAVLLASNCLVAVTHAIEVPVVHEVQCSVDEPVCIMVVPNGSGATFQQARNMNGDVVDATILVIVYWYDGGLPSRPYINFPADYLTLRTTDEGAVGCGNPPEDVTKADFPTQPGGWTHFQLAPRAGGWSAGQLEVYIEGVAASEANSAIVPLPIYVNSPDINGDLVVDLSDIVLFVQDLYGPDTPLRSNLVWDASINLSDVVVFTQYLGAYCAPGAR